jgi:hypothetical protein
VVDVVAAPSRRAALQATVAERFARGRVRAAALRGAVLEIVAR